MKAIFCKEIKTYFLTVQGYIFIGVFLLISGYYFVAYNLMGENAEIGNMLDNTIAAFVFLVPVLTMRLFAEEKHMKTDSVYMSAPLRTWQIVIGKYFAACFVFTVAVFLTLFSGIAVMAEGVQTAGEVFTVYIGYLLIGYCFISVGMLVSAMTESQLAAAVISFGVCLLLYLADWLKEAVSGRILEFAADVMSVASHFDKAVSGVLDIADIGYYLSFAALFVIFTIVKTESERYRS
ncbi:MAG: ABC transporter permease subunit [Clostridia bacterium]|nr:ABC transporter permease subunit [Clostridia bacterium]